MTILILQSLLLLLVAFIIGCLLGCVFRRFLSKEAAAERGVPAPPLSGGRAPQPAPRQASTPALQAEPSPALEPAVSAPASYAFTADRTDDAIVLSGRTQSAADRDKLLKRAQARFPELVIDDRLSVGGDAPRQVDWPAAMAFALDQLGGLSTGRVRLQDEVVSLSGTAADAAASNRIHAATHGDLPAGLTLGTFDLKGLAPQEGETKAAEDKIVEEPTTKVEAQPTDDARAAEEPDTSASKPDGTEPSASGAETGSEPDSKESELESIGSAQDGTAAATPKKKRLEIDALEGLSGQQPAGYAKARDGQADDLKRIKGIGKVNERKLNELGVWHLDQIAAWTDAEIAWVDGYLAFRGRIVREDWVGQAKELTATGAEKSDT